MIHEFKNILYQALRNQHNGIKNVLVTMVDLDGSSYRKPGVRMLLSSDGKMIGAVSGGCVEKEIQKRASSVFETNTAKIMTYDGRYRLGCEGILYILIEPFVVSEELTQEFSSNLELRKPFTIQSFFKKEDECTGNFGSIISFENNKQIPFFNTTIEKETEVFSEKLQPLFKLLIIGGEHDAVKLSTLALQMGWQVDVITSIRDPKQLSDFPGANSVIARTPELTNLSTLDKHTAIVIMNHNFAYDLQWLLKLQNSNTAYIGVLGAAKRREKLYDELLNFTPDMSDAFLEKIHTPAGLNIGAETPEEIALSIIAEILSVIRNKEVFSLKTITGKIHT